MTMPHMFQFLAIFILDDVLMYVALASIVAGAATSFVGAQASAQAAEDQGKMQAEAANAEARNAEIQAAESIKRERVNKRRRLARLRSDMSAGGVVMDDSSLDVFAETAGREELAIQDAARQTNLDAANTRNAGSMAQWEARALSRATQVKSYGTLLSDTATAASSYASTR